VEPGDRDGLAAAVESLVRDPERRRLGDAGRAIVRERFAWPVLVERTIALYEELLGARP
jgi:glycosyltransferase involved in cell wall biosynthesis